MDQVIEINNRRIGSGFPTYIVAEMSANHNQELERAINIIEAAKEAGADAIKIQTYTPDTLTINSDNDYFRVGKGAIWAGQSLYDLYSEAYMPWEWHYKLKQVADDMGLDMFSTAYDQTSVEFLEEMGVPAYKIASFEIVDFPLLHRVAKTNKPIILSTGMASLAEIEEAVKIIQETGCSQLALLKCTSAYPAPPEYLNLASIPHLRETFDVPVGLSDHTLGTVASTVAVTLGAHIIEKHFTIARDDLGPDSDFSLEPDEFREMVDAIRIAEKSLGSIRYGTEDIEKSSQIFRKSLFVVEDMKAGDIFTKDNVRSIRPGYGLHTRFIDKILGRCAVNDIARGTPLQWKLIGDCQKARR